MSCNYDCCINCLKVCIYIDKVKKGEFKQKRETDSAKAFELDYKLKNFLDAFSRGLSWVLGQTAYKLIVNKKSEKQQAKEDGGDEKEAMHKTIIDSELMSGGIEYRLVEQVFNKDNL